MKDLKEILLTEYRSEENMHDWRIYFNKKEKAIKYFLIGQKDLDSAESIDEAASEIWKIDHEAKITVVHSNEFEKALNKK